MKIRIDGFLDLPDHVRESALAKIEHADPRVTGWRPEPDGVAVDLAGGGADDPEVAERIEALVRETITSFRFFKLETLDEDAGAPTSAISPFPELLSTGQVAFISPGTPVYQGRLAQRLANLDLYFKHLAWSRGALEQIYPTTVATENLVRNGYLSSYPQHALMVAAIHRDVDNLATAAALSEGPENFARAITARLDPADEVLAPTVCYRCFESLRLTPRLSAALPQGRTFTGIANCHRCEDKALTELSRLQTFIMREVVFFGAADFVEQHRQWWIAHFADLMRRCRLRFRIVSASDPFFLQSAAKKRAYQSIKRLKYECQLHLPHADQWLAVASFNNHEATLVGAYDLTGADPALQSGCVGFGYDRLVFAALSQFGLDHEAWPPALQELLLERDQPTHGAWDLP